MTTSRPSALKSATAWALEGLMTSATVMSPRGWPLAAEVERGLALSSQFTALSGQITKIDGRFGHELEITSQIGLTV